MHRFDTSSKKRASYITDPPYRYLHKLIATSIAPREQSREWCTPGDLLYLYCLIWGERCALHCCLAQWLATAFHRQDRSVLYGWGGRTSPVSLSPWALFPSRTNYSWMGAWWSQAF
ncbi:hypothetical protein Hanom_Chr12g01159571 [Helianthus anomalus]